MSKLPLLEPADCALILVDEQAGLAFAAGSQDPQILRSMALRSRRRRSPSTCRLWSPLRPRRSTAAH